MSIVIIYKHVCVCTVLLRMSYESRIEDVLTLAGGLGCTIGRRGTLGKVVFLRRTLTEFSANKYQAYYKVRTGPSLRKGNRLALEGMLAFRY